LFVEHPHVVTLGRKSTESLLPGPETGVEIFEIERGGEATYHGPGQLVAYPIFKLESPTRDLHLYLRSLEDVIIDSIADVQLGGFRRSGATGVWVDPKNPRKIASIGIAIRRWVTYHGLALNVSTDLNYFNYISPCGFSPSVMTSIDQELQTSIPMDSIKSIISSKFECRFGIRLKSLTRSGENSPRACKCVPSPNNWSDVV